MPNTIDPTPTRTAQRLGPSEAGKRWPGAALIACAALATGVIAAGDPAATTSGTRLRRSTATLQPESQADLVLAGRALRANGTPLPGVLVVLRQIQDGLEAGRAKADVDGAFRLAPTTGGTFLIELHSVQGRLLSVTDPFEITGSTRGLDARLRAEVPWFVRFFDNAAAAAIRAASAHGMTAMGSNGQPVSPK